ncbi:MAG: hypothetical protein B6I19_01555, partial [Bacteroidetes bacterium 4572_114]
EGDNWVWPAKDDYVTINNSSGATYAQPGQAFMVMAASNNATINFNTNTRKHGTSSFYKNGNSDDVSRLNLYVTNSEGQGNSTLMAFMPGMTEGLDPSYDAAKMKGNPNIALYTRLVEDNGVDFAIQALPFAGLEDFEIAVGLDVLETTVIEFSAKQEQLDNYNITLEDRQENTFTNLRWDNYFADVSESGTGRFFLHFKDATAIGEITPQTNISCRYINGKLLIQNPDNETGWITLTNVSGQLLGRMEMNGNETQEFPINQPTGIYIISVQTGKASVNKKIFVN